jgi:hypothetical protein
MRVVAAGLVVGFHLLVGSAAAAPEPEKAATKKSATDKAAAEKPAAKPPTVRYRDDKVSVDLHEASVEAVLQALAKESGAELVGSTRAERPLTMSFDDVPVKEALERLVGAQNFTLKYDEAGKLRAIELRGGPEAAKAPKPGEPTKSEGENTTPAKQYAFFKAFDRSGTIPVSGELKKALGRDEVGWDYLGNTAIAHQDPRVRQAAMHALVTALDQDPEMKDSVLASLNAMSPEELAAFARERGHYRAEDLVRNVMRETSDQELRARARDVLRELRKTPFKGPRAPMH